MITARMDGRRLVLTVETAPDEEAIAPFVVAPFSAKRGREVSERYLFAIEDIPFVGDVGQDMLDALGRENAERADEECSSFEGELLLNAAYMWQTVAGMDAVRALLTPDPETGEQGGVESRGKAHEAFRLRVAPLLSQIRHRLESALQTHRDATPDTSSPQAGESSENGNDSRPSEAQPPSSNSSTPASDSPPSTD
jgi:hypothetical protein